MTEDFSARYAADLKTALTAAQSEADALRAEVERERSAVVAYLSHAADEADGLAGVAQTEATAAMFRAIRNAFTALGKSIADGDHLFARQALASEPGK